MKNRKNKQKPVKKADKNLAVISIILGATSLFYSIFTGIPAIVLGVMALRRNAGNRTQAKLGIAFGIFSFLIFIPISILLYIFLREPFKEQYSIPETDRLQVIAIQEKLQAYKKSTGAYPKCGPIYDATSCPDWDKFVAANPGLVPYHVYFEYDASVVEDRPVGTLVYVNQASCFLGTPTHPGYLEGDEKLKKPILEYAALVFFHEKGRSCQNVHEP